MLLAPDLVPAFGALALAVVSLWLPLPPLRGQRDWAWCAGLLLACAAGKATGVLDASGVAATFFYAALALRARERTPVDPHPAARADGPVRVRVRAA
jgi:hypothetical protein